MEPQVRRETEAASRCDLLMRKIPRVACQPLVRPESTVKGRSLIPRRTSPLGKRRADRHRLGKRRSPLKPGVHCERAIGFASGRASKWTNLSLQCFANCGKGGMDALDQRKPA
jgi:hypothetical protein